MRTLRVLLIAVTAAPLALVAATPAHAAAPVSCTGAGTVFSADAEGRLWRYGLSGLDGTTPAWSPRTQLGRGWSGFGRVSGGPDNRLYGINAQGVQRFRHTGSGWEPARTITPSWTAYATAAYRDKITVDQTGDFYLVDGGGRLLRSRYDEQARTWTTYNEILAVGWDRFDLIVAGAPGTLYAREPQGALFRFRYDPDSQRWLEQNRAVGTGWNRFTRGLMSAGGDILFGITAVGDMHHYRFEASDGSWPAPGLRIGTTWSAPNIAAVTDTCTAVATPPPGRPGVGFDEAAAPAAIQAGSDTGPGALHFAYTRDGTLFTGSAFPGGTGIEWTPEAGDYIGTPALIPAPDRTVQTFAQRGNSDYDVRDSDGDWTSLAGRFVDEPTAVRAADGGLVAFGVGVEGSFWHRRQVADVWLPWSRISSVGLSGEITAVPLPDGSVALLVVGVDEKIWTARYRDGSLRTQWVSMGDGMFAGKPAGVALPESALSVFARSATGEIRHQRIGTDGRVTGTWEVVGEAGALLGTGAPSAILDERTSRILVFRRTGDTVHMHDETRSGAQTWGPGTPVPGKVSSDPAAFTFRSGTDNGVTTSAFVVRDANGGLAFLTADTAGARSFTKRG